MNIFLHFNCDEDNMLLLIKKWLFGEGSTYFIIITITKCLLAANEDLGGVWLTYVPFHTVDLLKKYMYKVLCKPTETSDLIPLGLKVYQLDSQTNFFKH